LRAAGARESADCIAGLVLQGLKKPFECPAFGVQCTPERPLGAPWSPPRALAPPITTLGDAHMLELNFTCPVPLPAGDCILLAHGGGGTLMNQLIERVFLPAFSNPLSTPATTARF